MNPQSWFTSILVLTAAFLAVFWEAAFSGLRHVLGAQLDLLPPLMVYASLCGNFTTVCLLAFCGGLWFDSLSANPLGITVVPLLAVGLPMYLSRELILRNQTFAQVVLGMLASGIAPLLSLALLLSAGHAPLLGWGTLWQLVVLTVSGAVATPVCFSLLDLLHRLFLHSPATQTSFRPDREIRRGR